tara:strand:- start:32 stop:289 length:258 start_codon:yes stop_codon:yes gene_type:complete
MNKDIKRNNKLSRDINFRVKLRDVLGEQNEIRELIILNFIEWYASEEENREPLRQAMQLYLQQEIWLDLEGIILKEVGIKDYINE